MKKQKTGNKENPLCLIGFVNKMLAVLCKRCSKLKSLDQGQKIGAAVNSSYDEDLKSASNTKMAKEEKINKL